MTAALDILLNDRLVGTLTRLPGGASFFGFDDAYVNDPHRPTLSQFYLNAGGDLRTEARPARSNILPAWFSNLLPEGPLRDYLAARGQVHKDAEFDLLALLGDDLPGAVRAIPRDGDHATIDHAHTDDMLPAKAEGPLRFSLAGVQLKFSALLGKRGGLTIPASGIGGDWIVKLPSVIYPKVPENEAAMLTLAAQVGLEVPEHRLVPLSEIEGLPQLGEFASRQALAIKRFDRGPDGQRIHMEDLAQVFGIMPHEKYEHVGFARIAEMIGIVMGTAAVQDFIARLVVMILTGNGDMHLKNWSLLYPDGRMPILSPSYDLVSTIPYISEDGLALNFAGKKKFSDINKERFQRLAEKAQISERETMLTIERVTDATIAAWNKLKLHTAMDDGMVQQIDQHMKIMARKLK